ncbi:MAG TPA: Ig-like domain-containing protein [Gemmatimonadales bacterium]|nr:Ig-like domain-containing protein [Gemmatimonadales bacterium]
MLIATIALLAAVQQGSPPPAQAAALAPSPIARLEVQPGTSLQLPAGDSVQLVARALDASGQPVPDASIRFFGAGGRFEGTVDSTGMVRSGSTGTLAVSVIARVTGTKPVVERVEVQMVPGPAARVTVAPQVSKLVVGQRLRLTGASFSQAGDARDDQLAWKSSAPGVVTVSQDGVLGAVAPGRATITAGAGAAKATLAVQVVANTIARVELTPARTEARTGDVVKFAVKLRDAQGRELAGLTPSWTFAPGGGEITPAGEFVGYQAGSYFVTVTIGSASAEAAVTLRPRDVRRPAEVVGRLPRTRFTTEEVWVMPDGKHAFLGSGSGGDVLYAINVSDPAAPVVTDSLVLNTRRVNDVMSTPDGKFIVMTREGAADRKNGIVIASTEDPEHPKVIAEFTEGVTSGVHSAFVYRQDKYGTNVFLTNDGTGAMHVINIDDPYHPKEIAQWRTERPDAGRTLHDIDIQDGLAYLSYWNDGLVILDVGNGVKGGSPSSPQLVSQFKYDLNALYRDVEAAGGPGFIRGTHTAWRHGKYVFIADEVFPNGPTLRNGRDASAGRAYGRLQVIDVSDWNNPHSVAYYEPEFGGVHNVWVAGDTLYMGAYNAGFRAFDISGELRGDLRAQGRQIAHVNTADMEGHTKNAAMTWGVVVKDGLSFVNDDNNGLWIVRMEPRQPPAAVP